MKKLLQSLFLLLFIGVSAIAQAQTVTGTVTAREDGLPLPGVSIIVKGTQVGTQTGADGRYSITVPQGSSQIEVRYVGYTTQTIDVNGRANVNVVLVIDSRQLGEIVVTANAIEREKRTLGYSAPTVNAEDLTEGANPNVLNSLTGRVAGVNITGTANTPGSSSRIVLRGGSSISGSNQALIVIDGIPIDNSSVIGAPNSATTSSLASTDFGNRGNDVDPNDIASVTVLKGPAAAALYGARASNGALIITTKSGAKGTDKTEIAFTTNNSFSSILKLPDFQNEYGQGYYDSGSYHADPQENWSWGAPFDGTNQEWGQEIDGVRQTKPYSAQKDNIKNFFNTGFGSDNNLSVSGGGQKTSFFMSLNSLNSDGIMPGAKDTYNKYGVRFNGSAELSSKFNAGISFNYNRINQNAPGGGQGASSIYNQVIQTPRDIPLDQLGDLNNKYNGYGFTDANGVRRDNLYGFYGAYTQNPYWVIQNYNNLNDVNRVTGNFNLNYKPAKWLTIQERLGVDTYGDRRRFESPKFSYTPADEAGNYSPAPRTNVGLYEINQFNVSEIVHDLMLTANHKFSDDFTASLMVGNNIRQRTTNSNRTATNASGGLVVPGWYNLSNSNGPINILEDRLTKRRLVGLYADLNLGFKNMLFLEATARNDWSSTLPKQNNSFFYPSVSTSFIFTELMKNSSFLDVLNYGKLRASYAEVGNDTDPYQLLSTYARGTITAGFGSTIFPFGNVTALQAGSTIGNANLRPEQTIASEIGVELGFFDNRLAADVSLYKSNSKDQIISIPIPNSTGFGFSVVNAGEIENKGIEVSLRGTPIRTNSGFEWEVYGTYTKNNNTVLSLMDGVDQLVIGGFSGMSIVAAKGRTYGEFFSTTNVKDAQGRTVVNRATGIPLITTKAEYFGSYNPDYLASLGSSFKLKNWNLNVLFDTKQGGVFYSRTKDNMAFTGTSKETGGERLTEVFPNSVYLDASGASVTNTTPYLKQDYYSAIPDGMNIVDATYVKLRTLGLSYRFNKAQLGRTGLSSATLGVFGNNLFLWTPSSNQWVDPEINSGGAGNEQGFDFTANPSVRNYGVNLRVTF